MLVSMTTFKPVTRDNLDAWMLVYTLVAQTFKEYALQGNQHNADNSHLAHLALNLLNARWVALGSTH